MHYSIRCAEKITSTHVKELHTLLHEWKKTMQAMLRTWNEVIVSGFQKQQNLPWIEISSKF